MINTEDNAHENNKSESDTKNGVIAEGAMREIPIRDALKEAMTEEMERDERVFLVGEEVGAYNGAYKCSKGMLEQFGPKRVIDAPIAECGFTGVGVGAAMVGLRPIIEFMTFNFSLVAIDQILNAAAKTRLMSGGQYTLPIVFRGAGGAAHQLSAQHSNSFENFYAYTPGLIVLAPATPADMKGMLKSAIRNDNPVVFFESELTYSLKGPVPTGEYLVPIGKADIKREGSDITLISWSKVVFLTMEIADELAKQGISAEVIDLRSLRPLDTETIYRSVAKTNRAVVIQEQHSVASFGAYISHLISTECFDDLDAPVGLVSSEECPVPYSKGLEPFVVVNKDRALAAIQKVLG
jgi:pyruvate dehydrogenase E1 component beta subunit